MNGWEWLAAGLELWTALGLVGVGISLFRGERRKLQLGVLWLVGVWVVYLALLLGVSAQQRERHVRLGESVCFSGLCYTVRGVEELTGFPARDRHRLLRLTVALTNHNPRAAREEVSAVLRDGAGRIFLASAGVSGNRLDARVAAGATVLAQPVFELPPDAAGLGLIVSHGRWSRAALVVGDGESLNHRSRVFDLGE